MAAAQPIGTSEGVLAAISSDVVPGAQQELASEEEEEAADPSQLILTLSEGAFELLPLELHSYPS
jgi:hypothetical protein